MIKFTADVIIEENIGKPFGDGIFTMTWFNEHKHEFKIVEMVPDCSRSDKDTRTILRLQKTE